MSTPILITANKSLVLGSQKSCLERMHLCPAAAISTLEVFDGAIDVIATFVIKTAGTLYAVGDLVTLEDGNGGTNAVFKVTTVDAPETGVITALGLVDAGSGYPAGDYDTTTNSVAGTGAQVTVSTVTDIGTSIGKILTPATESQGMDFCEVTVFEGFSVRITGTNAKGYIYYE
jgi:hypothetical protein